MTRAGIYVRISQDREGLEAGVRRQEADCRAQCGQRGWEIAAVYRDNDVSATDRRKKRPEYRRMIDDLREGRLDALVAYSSSRFYRRARDLEELIDLLENRRVEVATVASGSIDLSTADGRMLARILASVDQAEAERLAERSKRAKAEIKKTTGGWLGGGQAAFGYERSKDERGKTVHRIREDEAGRIRRAAEQVLSGTPLYRVARGMGWAPSRLRVVLTSPFHAGLHADGTPGSWPAIFTADEHVLLRARLPRRRGDARPDRRYRLTGLLHCSECGHRMLGSGGRYKCDPRNSGCGKTRVAAHHLDAYVEGETFAREETWEADPARQVDEAAGRVASDGLLAELRNVAARRQVLADGYAAGTVPLDDFRRAVESLSRRAAELEGQVRQQAEQSAPRVNFAELAQEPSVLDWNDFYCAVIEEVAVSPALRRGRGAEADVPGRTQIAWR